MGAQITLMRKKNAPIWSSWKAAARGIRGKTLDSGAEDIGTANHTLTGSSKVGGVVNKTFVQMMEALGYDIGLAYVKREE